MAYQHRQHEIAETLLESGIIDEEQLGDAEREQARTGLPLVDVLNSQGAITDEQRAEVAELERAAPHVDLSQYIADPELLSQIPREVARRRLVFPLLAQDGVLTLAMANPADYAAIVEVERLTGREVRPVAAPAEDIRQALITEYAVCQPFEELIRQARLLDLHEDGDRALHLEDIARQAGESPIVAVVSRALLEAVRSGASDIHLTPMRDTSSLRNRVDGELRNVATMPKALHRPLVARFKVLASLDVAENRLPQDGRFTCIVGGKELDMRMSCLPTVVGEKIVVRLLEKGRSMTLEELGPDADEAARMRRFLQYPHGIIIVTGPTGSGKTATLHAMLLELNQPRRNIITVEDPVEYELPGAAQVQVHPGIGLSFGRVLRWVLRQDPDVIMVGEMRDQETAALCMRAALTGHLVFSTLHTNDAPGAVTRLLDLGIERFMVAEAVHAVLAQRLMRRLCPYCRREAPLPAELADEAQRIGVEAPSSMRQPGGCRLCGQTGYRGRTAVYQILEMTRRVKHLIYQGAEEHAIAAAGAEAGMLSLRQRALRLVLDGISSVEELERIAKSTAGDA